MWLSLFSASATEPVHYFWFDQLKDYTTYQGSSVEASLDVSTLSEGFHSLNHVVVTGDGKASSPKSSIFIKTASLSNGQDINCSAIVDNKDTKLYNCAIADGSIHVDMDMAGLSDGLHTLTVFLHSKTGHSIYVPKSAFFIKMPETGTGIARYSYWIDDNTDDVVTVDLPGDKTSCEIVKLLNVKSYPFISKSFKIEFYESGAIRMYSAHNLNFYATDKSGRRTPVKSANYIDVNSYSDVKASDIQSLDPCIKKNIGKLGTNTVKWYRISANKGDSLIFKTDAPCLIDLFTSDGVNIMSRKAYETLTDGGCYADRTGDFYLAVHDVASNHTPYNVYLDYAVIDRFAVLSHYPKVSGQSDFVRLDLTGNGFDNLKKVRLKSQNQIIPAYDLDITSRNTAGAIFDLSESVAEETYNIELIFEEEGGSSTVTVPNGLKVIGSTPDEITVEVIPSRKVSTPYDVTIRVTNTGSTPYWGIPFNIGLPNTGAGSKMIFRNFFPMVSEAHKDYVTVGYYTSNFLDTGEYGWYFPMVISHIGSHETLEFNIGFVSTPHQSISLYAWTGEPWSEEFKRLTDENLVLDEFNRPATNYLRAVDIVHFEALSRNPNFDEWLNENNSKKKSRAVNPGNAMDVATLSVECGYMIKDGIANTGAKTNDVIQNGLLWDMPEGMTDEYSCARNISKAYKSEMRVRSAGDIAIDATTPSWVTISQWLWQFFTSAPLNTNPTPERHEFEILQSGDPNALSGYVAESGSEYIGLDTRALPYSIEFENDPEIASASACSVVVKDHLDPTVFDISTFKPLGISFAGHDILLKDSPSQIITEDMRPEINCIAQINLTAMSSGDMLCTITSLDPMSMEPTDLAPQGFLPVNKNGSGTGSIEFEISLNPDVENNTKVKNSAEIIFDDNTPIKTQEWLNITDFLRPTSFISNLTKSGDSELEIEFHGEDHDSGVWYYQLYARKNSDEWMLICDKVADDKTFISIDPEAYYEFMSLAVDKAGNHESKVFEPEFIYDKDIIHTGFDSPFVKDPKQKTDGMYDMLGRKILNNPAKGNIYIKSGKKIAL